MAYITGSANSFSDLLSALRNACTANGWTLSGEILHKGTCYVRTRLGEDGTISSPTPPLNTKLIIQAGTGKDGSNLLTGYYGDSLSGPRIGLLRNGATYPDWDWPVTYHIHVNTSPDEVAMMVNYDGGSRFQHLMFGQSPSPGNPGTGNWDCGTIGEIGTLNNIARYTTSFGFHFSGFWNTYAGGVLNPIPFWPRVNNTIVANYVALNFHVHGCISTADATIWSSMYRYTGEGSYEGEVSSSVPLQSLINLSPNSWNNEAILFPIQITQYRLSNKRSLIAELKHIRIIRNTYISDGTVLTYGADKWKVYSCHKKDVTVPSQNDSGDHSGTFAVAIRYDGP